MSSSHLFKVLVADDEYWICESLRNMLNWEEYSFSYLEPAYDGEDALDKIESDRPDIVITDINMPFVSGTELIKIIKKRYPDMVVLVLSGYSDFDYVRESLLAGAVDYLLKPITKSNLVKVLTKSVDIIGGHRADRREQKEAKEKLKIASSILLDKEMSRMIKSSKASMELKAPQSQMSEYELNFAGFTLVMFKTCSPSQIMHKKHMTDANQVSYQIKSILSECLKNQKFTVFNNIYLPNQYILIADMDGECLQRACDRMIAALQNYTGSCVSAAVSSHYFSFSDIKNAYNESVLAQMARFYRNKSEKINSRDIGSYSVKKRMNPEQENQLIFAVQNNAPATIRNIIFDSVGLPNCVKDRWRFIEVKQTIDSIIRILTTNSTREYSPTELMAIDNFSELLKLAFESCNVSELCSILEQMIDELFSSSDSSVTSDTMRKTVKQVQDYINKNYFSDLSLTMLSKKFLVERSYLSKAFKQETGKNLMLYLSEVRINKAKEYIRQNQLNLTKISQLVGYDDYGYFNRVFRKITAVSPREYKKSLGFEKNDKN